MGTKRIKIKRGLPAPAQEDTAPVVMGVDLASGQDSTVVGQFARAFFVGQERVDALNRQMSEAALPQTSRQQGFFAGSGDSGGSRSVPLNNSSVTDGVGTVSSIHTGVGVLSTVSVGNGVTLSDGSIGTYSASRVSNYHGDRINGALGLRVEVTRGYAEDCYRVMFTLPLADSTFRVEVLVDAYRAARQPAEEMIDSISEDVAAYIRSAVVRELREGLSRASSMSQVLGAYRG